VGGRPERGCAAPRRATKTSLSRHRPCRCAAHLVARQSGLTPALRVWLAGKDALPKLLKALAMAAGLAADASRWPAAWWSLPAGASPAPVLPSVACVPLGAKRKRTATPAAAGSAPSAEVRLADEAPAAATAPPPYIKLRRSEWTLCPQPRPRSKAASSVCECDLPAGFVLPQPAAAAADGAKQARPAAVERVGCGYDCQNRLTFTFCDSRTCPCSAACANRPFHQLQQPRTKPFLTRCGRGWGLKAVDRIPRGTFVVEYIGEILNDVQCAQRLAADKERGETNFYMMEVNRNQVIDARYKGNVSRLINSACQPNCETQRWVDGGSGETRVGIFTMRDVAAGEELTCAPSLGPPQAFTFV
jgi:histone-lysine N-methyltransferase NSD1